jgi:drug/metabolite transporter (DMT)-like permease
MMPHDAAARAVGLFLLGGIFFVALNAIAKALTPELGPILVIWARFFFHVLLAVMLFPSAVVGVVRTPQVAIQVGRSLLLMTSTICNFLALWYLPLADVSAIIFTAPLVVAGLAVVFLKERVSAARWVAIVVGMGGAVIIVRPGSGVLGLGALLAFGCTLAYSVYQVSTRILREVEPIVSLIYSGLSGLILFSLLAPFAWEMPTPTEWIMLILMGGCGAIGHLFVIMALQRVEASRLSPFTYIQLVWSILASVLIFGDIPTMGTLLGAGIIVASGLYVWHLNRVETTAASARAAE